MQVLNGKTLEKWREYIFSVFSVQKIHRQQRHGHWQQGPRPQEVRHGRRPVRVPDKGRDPQKSPTTKRQKGDGKWDPGNRIKPVFPVGYGY